MVEKAKIIVFDKGGSKTDEISVMFNPSEYSVTAEGNISGEGSGIQFNKVNVNDFTVTLFFDTYEQKSDVRSETSKIVALVVPTVEGTETKQPPICIFSWGGFGFKGIIYKATQRFTMFLQSGIPVRCELSIIFKSVMTKAEDAEFKGKEACRKLWTVRGSDRLDRIAFTALGDAAAWRRIADANAIVDPLSFPTKEDLGITLVIPD